MPRVSSQHIRQAILVVDDPMSTSPIPEKLELFNEDGVPIEFGRDLSRLHYAGPWDEDLVYAQNDVVYYDAALWFAPAELPAGITPGVNATPAIGLTKAGDAMYGGNDHNCYIAVQGHMITDFPAPGPEPSVPQSWPAGQDGFIRVNAGSGEQVTLEWAGGAIDLFDGQHGDRLFPGFGPLSGHIADTESPLTFIVPEGTATGPVLVTTIEDIAFHTYDRLADTSASFTSPGTGVLYTINASSPFNTAGRSAAPFWLDTGATPAYRTITGGDASTNVITAPAHGFAEGEELSLSDIVGGAYGGSLEGAAWYARNVTTDTFKLASAPTGGYIVDFTTNITSGKVTGQSVLYVVNNHATATLNIDLYQVDGTYIAGLTAAPGTNRINLFGVLPIDVYAIAYYGTSGPEIYGTFRVSLYDNANLLTAPSGSPSDPSGSGGDETVGGTGVDHVCVEVHNGAVTSFLWADPVGNYRSWELLVREIPSGGLDGYYLSKASDEDFDVEWSSPVEELPSGGVSGSFLSKTSGADGDVGWTAPPHDLPVGGASGYLLAKSSGSDRDVGWVAPPHDLPAGGATGYVLAKASGSDRDVGWVAQTPRDVPVGGTTDQVLAKNSNTDRDLKWATPASGGSTLSRRTSAKTTASLSAAADTGDPNTRLAGGGESGIWTLSKGALLMKIATDVACRVRLYTTAAKRTADVSRDRFTDPTGDHGCLTEMLMIGTLSYDTIPVDYLFSGVGDSNIYYRIENYSLAAGAITVTLTVIDIES